MSVGLESTLARLLEGILGYRHTETLLEMIEVSPTLLDSEGETVPRGVLAMAMNLMLFKDILQRVPQAKGYVQDQLEAGRKVIFDHGALRTVKSAASSIPSGHLAFGRFLEPLGYRVNGVYPLDRISMTGFAYTHEDFPEQIPQFFVSELHPERFSPAFQEAVDRIISTSRDPLPQWAFPMLDELAEMKELPFSPALQLLPHLVECFNRLHEPPRLSDYKTLLAESAEMAWIATEGNAFNHATDRVEDVEAVSNALKAKGRPVKNEVERSASGRIMQTAFLASAVDREFVDDQGQLLIRTVPGSFFEFITRKTGSDGKLDLHFDAANAQAIFKMTASEWC